MRPILFATIFLFAFSFKASSQLFEKPIFYGMYIQWGYNRDCYSKSDIHFKNGSQYDFTVHNAVADDKPNFEGIYEAPTQITIPQYNYRIGFYLNKAHTHAIELNFDHAKYVMRDDQNLYISGSINGEVMNKDTIITHQFLHFEHTDGANFCQLNYVGQTTLLKSKKTKKKIITTVYKLGGGVVVPRTDFTYMGHELNNKFHVAGYIISMEAGARVYPLNRLFLEFTGKTGFANYLNALTLEGGSARHHFYYGEVIATIGYEINFKKHKKLAH